MLTRHHHIGMTVPRCGRKRLLPGELLSVSTRIYKENITIEYTIFSS